MPWGESLGFGFRPYWDQLMYVKDQDGNLIPIPRPIPEVRSLEAQEEHDHLPSFEDQSFGFTITGKMAKRLIRMITRDLDKGRRKKRTLIRKREDYRRACIKYPPGSKRWQLSLARFQKAYDEYHKWRVDIHGQG